MSTLTNDEKIKEWRKANPNVQLTARLLCDIIGADLAWSDLSCADLSGADLRGADLHRANLSWSKLRGADLSKADLHETNLRDADLRVADLSEANLRKANLSWADLSWANLRGADLHSANLNNIASEVGIFSVNGLQSGHVQMLPTPEGWELKVDCWSGTVDKLEALIHSEEGNDNHRPELIALIALLRAHQEYHCDLIHKMAKFWPNSCQRGNNK